MSTFDVTMAAAKGSRKQDLAAFIAEQIRLAISKAPGRPIDEAMVSEAIAKFEEPADGEGMRVVVISTEEERDVHQAMASRASVAEHVAGHLSKEIQDGLGDTLARNPAPAVAALISENITLRAGVHEGRLVREMHDELVFLLGDLVRHLSADAPKELVEKAQRIVERAKAGATGVPIHVTPQQMLVVIEHLGQAHQEVVYQFQRQLTQDQLKTSIAVLSEALNLVKEVPAPVVVISDSEVPPGHGEAQTPSA